MHGIYTYTPETNHVAREYSVAAILQLLFMVHITLFPMLNLLYAKFALEQARKTQKGSRGIAVLFL